MFTLTNLPRIHHYGGFSGFERRVDIGGIDQSPTYTSLMLLFYIMNHIFNTMISYSRVRKNKFLFCSLP